MEATSSWATGGGAARLGKPGKGREELQRDTSARISAPAGRATMAKALGRKGWEAHFHSRLSRSWHLDLKKTTLVGMNTLCGYKSAGVLPVINCSQN